MQTIHRPRPNRHVVIVHPVKSCIQSTDDANAQSPIEEFEESSQVQQKSKVIRNLPVIALPMTQGNDVLFPGCHLPLTLDKETYQRISSTLSCNEIPEFAYIPLNAWGDPSTVGTIAIIEHIPESWIENDENIEIIASGITRFQVQSLSDDMHEARVEIFSDNQPKTEQECDEIVKLEGKLVSAMKAIVTLTIKISDDDQHDALRETLKRVELFYTQQKTDDDGESNNSKTETENENGHWMLELTPGLRRELLSFTVIDMLSVSFMDRRAILEATDTASRLQQALDGLEPFVKELAAKGAIVGVLGKNSSSSFSADDDDSMDKKKQK